MRSQPENYLWIRVVAALVVLVCAFVSFRGFAPRKFLKTESIFVSYMLVGQIKGIDLQDGLSGARGFCSQWFPRYDLAYTCSVRRIVIVMNPSEKIVYHDEIIVSAYESGEDAVSGAPPLYTRLGDLSFEHH